MSSFVPCADQCFDATVSLALFRTFVAGRSLDLEEARSLMSELPLTSSEVSRIRRTPVLLMPGRRLL